MTDQILDENMVKEVPKNYVGFGLRLVAYIIDGAIFTLIGYLIFGEDVVNTSHGFSVSFNNEEMIVPFGYFFISWATMSTTVGKMVLGMKIVDESGEKMNITAVFVRIVGYIVLFIGCWFILGNDKKQALHDKMAKTFVVKK